VTALFDELAHAGAAHVGDAAASYDEKIPFDPRDDVRLLCELGLDRTKTLLDMGAGTGRFAVAAARYAGDVIAVDISPAMQAAFERRRLLLRGRRIRFVLGGFLSYEHEGEPVDFVYSRNAIHHLPDIWKVVALQRLHDVLKPGGVLVLRGVVFRFEPAETVARIEAYLAAASSDPAKGFTRDELEVVLPRKTFSWLMEPMLERCGFAIERARYGHDLYAEYLCRRV
jgi:SAM-dependent methyltransferase